MVAIRNLWDKVMHFSRTHGSISVTDRQNLDGVVVATSTLMSDLTAPPDLMRSRVQIAVSKVDIFNNAHAELRPPDTEHWDAIVGAVNGLATVTGAGPGTLKRP
jgi:hypothetical protein